MENFFSSQMTALKHSFIKNQQSLFCFLQLVVEIQNFPKQIFINIWYHFFENWQNSRLFKRNYWNINFYYCCYNLNGWFFFLFEHIYTIILPKTSKVCDFSWIILEISTFLMVHNFLMHDFLRTYTIILTNIGQNLEFLQLIIKL